MELCSSLLGKMMTTCTALKNAVADALRLGRINTILQYDDFMNPTFAGRRSRKSKCECNSLFCKAMTSPFLQSHIEILDLMSCPPALVHTVKNVFFRFNSLKVLRVPSHHGYDNIAKSKGVCRAIPYYNPKPVVEFGCKGYKLEAMAMGVRTSAEPY